MKVDCITPIAWLCVFALFAATSWSSHRTRERTECYRHATSIEQCSRPDAIERVVRWLYS